MGNNESKEQYGSRLVELREAINLSTDGIAKRLQIAKSIVMNIESGNTEQIPRVFLRGYITSYAELVNLPSDELEEYLQGIEQRHETLSGFKHYSQIRKQKRYGKRIATISFCMLLLFGGVAGFFFWQGHNRTEVHFSESPLTKKITADLVSP